MSPERLKLAQEAMKIRWIKIKTKYEKNHIRFIHGMSEKRYLSWQYKKKQWENYKFNRRLTDFNIISGVSNNDAWRKR